MAKVKSQKSCKAKTPKALAGTVIHKSYLYDILCNGKNHYTVSEWGAERQCGCFCKKATFKKKGFTTSLLTTPTVDDGVLVEKSATMQWLEERGVL